MLKKNWNNNLRTINNSKYQKLKLNKSNINIDILEEL